MMLTDDLTELIAATSAGIARAYRVEQDDVAQEMWAWALTHSKMVERNLDHESDGAWRVRRALWGAGKRYALAEKAARDGYSVDDLYFYDTATIDKLLPYALGVESMEDATFARPAGEEKRKRTALPNEGNNFATMVADVESALATLNGSSRAFLVSVAEQGDHPDWEWLGEYHEITAAAARRRYNRNLKSLQSKLGGANPWAGGDRTGSRTVMSNERAMNVTRFQRDGAW